MDYDNKPEGYYNNIREDMIAYLPKNAKRILDVGCGDGAFSQLIKQHQDAEIWGIEYMDEEARKAAGSVDKIFSGRCEDHIPDMPDGYFDAVFFNDVLEHLVDPYEVLELTKAKLSPNGVIISSIPNIRYYKNFLKLIFQKEWQYEAKGVMDKTHLRFFTGKSIQRMYEDLGYTVLLNEGVNPTSSIKPFLFNIPFLFTQMDIRYLQYVTVSEFKKGSQ